MTLILDALRRTLNPDMYHGASGRRPFFEGWYYKLVDASERARYAIIPGISRGRHAASDHAFVQILDGSTGRVEYLEYPIGEFASAPDRFDITIGPNRFTRTSVALDVDRGGVAVRGRLALQRTVPLPVSLAAPGIMGWYAWVPFMECYHGVVSLDHRLAGSLSILGASVDFTGGRGYSEKDWGHAFPEAYVWAQSNHFDLPGASLTASIAVIPWLFTAFPGFIVGLRHAGVLYRFATYTGAETEALRIGDEAIDWTIRDRRHRLSLRLSRRSGGILHAPTTLTMDRRVAETLNATLHVRLEEIGGKPRTIFEGTGRCGGLEVAGDLSRLLDLQRSLRRR